MQCLMCGRELGEGCLKDILFSDDLLCSSCRREWKHVPQKFKVNGVPGRSDYLYHSGFSVCLLQYKECGDEALKDIFLQEIKGKLKHRYQGWTLCLMPSSQEKKEERGFDHLRQIFSCTGLSLMEPFEKKTSFVQKELGYQERQQMQTTISLKKGIVLPEKIVLCDDVITTGATLKGALACIDQKCHKIQIYVIGADNQGEIMKKGEEWS